MNLLLDTNAWSYVAQEEALPELLRVSVKRKIRLLIAPASVTEARAVKDPSRRKAVLAVMTDPRLTRLMPETFLESQDIKETLLAARPAWANPKPDASDFLRNRHYWRRSTGGFWDMSRDEVEFQVTDESLRGDMEAALAR